MNVKGSSGRTAARLASSSAMSRLRPRSRTSSSGIAPSFCAALCAPLPPASGGSITITVRRFGTRSRIATIFSSWLSSSHTIAHAPESAITHRHSSGEFVW